MPAPQNAFKAALKAGQPQIGCWVGMANAYAAEIAATAGFDWLLVDGEHAPNDLRTILEQVRVIEASASHSVARLPVGEAWMIKQYLDAGVQTLLVPMVESGEQAQDLARAVRYPPKGVRGVGSALARASRFAAIPDYLTTADDQICLLVQVENRAGLAALDDILATDVDGVFIGPSDLAADMGHIGNAGHPDVVAAVQDAMRRIVAAGKSAGILTLDPAMQRACLDLGATFVATGIDVTLFAGAMRNAAKAGLTLLPDQTASGTAQTQSGSKYLQQLCKHWSHKAEVSFDAHQGSVSYADGHRVAMRADDTSLTVTAETGPRDDIARWKDVIERHLARFAFREEFRIDWSD
ncbi:aldolase/citrate lyase family protein [Ruegeria halocynthiae]|uniref:aldolase/citrate lyase family protein n=1 Tax=Ruegeria halocynthiae TaxID=985054 RepID=UPI000565D493|nr:aldolase/citrate lyase family protein [Ruegeria halocynthiae]